MKSFDFAQRPVVLALTLLGTACALGVSTAVAAQTTKPNILFIVSDDTAMSSSSVLTMPKSATLTTPLRLMSTLSGLMSR